MQQLSKLELHYVFPKGDTSHELDAFVRNKCEDAFLKIVQEISNSLGEYIIISVEPHTKGGLRDVYRFIISAKGKNIIQLSTSVGTFFVALITLIMQLPSDNEKKLSELSVIKTELEIKKLQLELAQLKGNGNTVNTNEIVPIRNNVKIRRQKSHFYSKVIECAKIQKVEFSEIDVGSEKNISKNTVSIARQDFDKFIENNIYIPSEIIENATIEIIAPVLVRSKIQWKGILKTNGDAENKIIDFKMLDIDFQSDVLGQKIPFRHGTHIECTVELQKKVDAEGTIIISRYDVVNVTRVYDGAGTNIAMPQRKKNYAPKDNQPTLFDVDSFANIAGDKP
ncbi:MAG: hypothetical protein LBD14_01765 [Puniceicoccales bacterium]|nr:hypothetical protein [Puniceicoccales bacterium]